MAVYALTDVTTLFTTASATAELTASATNRYRLLELAFGVLATPASQRTMGLGRPGATGVTPTTPVTLIAVDSGNPAGTAQLTTVGWGTAPTVPANFMRRFSIFHATWLIWEFPVPPMVDVSKSLVLWNINTSSALDLYVEIDE